MKRIWSLMSRNRDSTRLSRNSDASGGRLPIPQIDRLSDADLQRLNALLPWACYVLDGRGRRFGVPYSETKRVEPQTIPDPRIEAFHSRFSIAGRHVLEVGCFEGMHTLSLSALGAQVTAVDARIENVVKTIVRCALAGAKPDVRCLDVDAEAPDLGGWDVLLHIGVLYHLADPVRHLRRFASQTRQAMLLDSHVADPAMKLEEYEVEGTGFRHYRYREAGRSKPFAGMTDHAKWLLEDDIVSLLSAAGFTTIEVVERRAERNGPRILLHAFR